MIKVFELTDDKASQLKGVIANREGVFFYVVIDADGKNIISDTQVDNCDHIMNPKIHLWIHDLPEIEYNPVVIDI